jgi:hypothetical protein
MSGKGKRQKAARNARNALRLVMLNSIKRSAHLIPRHASAKAVATNPPIRRASFLVQCGLEDVHSRLPAVLPYPLPATSSPAASPAISLVSCGLFHSAAVTSSGACVCPP